MHETIVSPLAAWESFYVIIGSSAAALTGLQFVVIALVAEIEKKSTRREIDAFGTPTVVHFCVVLLLGAILTAPWRSLAGPAVALSAVGVAGVTYVAVVIKRTRHQKGYKPVFEDWLWHSILPFLAYLAIVAAAAVLPRDPAPVLFVIAAAALLLLFIGIHNSWDTVTYIAIDQVQESKEKDQGQS